VLIIKCIYILCSTRVGSTSSAGLRISRIFIFGFIPVKHEIKIWTFKTKAIQTLNIICIYKMLNKIAFEKMLCHRIYTTLNRSVGTNTVEERVFY
jgi:hypothetical protein